MDDKSLSLVDVIVFVKVFSLFKLALCCKLPFSKLTLFHPHLIYYFDFFHLINILTGLPHYFRRNYNMSKIIFINAPESIYDCNFSQIGEHQIRLEFNSEIPKPNVYLSGFRLINEHTLKQLNYAMTICRIGRMTILSPLQNLISQH